MENNQSYFVKKEKDYIRRLIIEKKYQLAELIVDSFLNHYPLDIEMIRYKAEILLKNGEYDKAIEKFKYIINNYNTGHFELFKCLHLNGNYEEAYKMIPIIENILPNFELRLFKVFYEYNLNINNGKLPLTYLEMQICSYNEDKALLHIGFHEDIVDGKEKHSIFDENINVKSLYYSIKNRLLLGNSVKNSKFALCDEYYYKYPNIGLISGKKVDYLKVVTISGTTNIVTMYPSELPINGVYNDFCKIDRYDKSEKIELSKSIKESIANHNYELAYKKLLKHESKYGEDIYAMVFKTRTLIGLQQYEEAIDYAERSIITTDKKNNMKVLLWFLYNHTKRYEEAAIIFGNFLKNNFADARNCIAFYKKLGILNPKTVYFNEDIEKTIFNYDREYVIQKIDNTLKENDTYNYSYHISLNELFSRIENSIKKSERTLVLTDFYDKYCFTIDDLFTDKKGNQIHYIIVKVVPNSTDIISIIPLPSCGNYITNSLDIPTVAKKSEQIDKFYARMRKK